MSIGLIFKNLFKNCGKFNIVLSGVLIKITFYYLLALFLGHFF